MEVSGPKGTDQATWRIHGQEDPQNLHHQKGCRFGRPFLSPWRYSFPSLKLSESVKLAFNSLHGPDTCIESLLTHRQRLCGKVATQV